MKLVSIFIAVLTFLSCDSLIAQNYWQRVQVGGLLDESYDLIPTSDNGSIACGTVNSNFNQDTYIVKFDEFGNIEWERVIDRDQGGLYEIAVQLLELEDHYFIAVAGSGSSFFADILKLNFDGELVSERRNEGFDISNLLLASDNEIYAFQRDIFGASNILAKYNSDLVEQWTLELANTTFNIIDSYSFVNAEGNFQMVSNVEGLNPSTVEVSPDGAIVSEVIAGETLGLLGDLVLSHDLDDNRLVVVGAGRINNQNEKYKFNYSIL